MLSLSFPEKIRLAIEVLNIVRLAAADVLPANWAERLVTPSDAMIRKILDTVLDTDSKSRSCDSSDVEFWTAIRMFKLALEDCLDQQDESIDASTPFKVIDAGRKICHYLLGPECRVSVLADLNSLAVTKHAMTASEYFEEMVLIKERLELLQDRHNLLSHIGEVEKAIDDYPDMVPTAKRIVEFAMINGISYSLGNIVRRNNDDADSDHPSMEVIENAVQCLESLTAEYTDQEMGVCMFAAYIRILLDYLNSNGTPLNMSGFSTHRISAIRRFMQNHEDDRYLLEIFMKATRVTRNGE